MPRINVNPNATVSNFEPVAAGTYRMKFIAVEQKMKQGGEHPYLEWQLEQVAQDVKGIHGGSAGRVYDVTTLKPDAQFALRGLVEAVGLSWQDFDTEDVIGREVDVVLSLGTNQSGKPRNEVEKYIRAA